MQSRCFEERERQSFAIISTSLVCAKLSFYGQMRIHLISSFSIESHSNEGRTLNLSKITQPRLVYGSFVTQTRDEEIKGGYDGVVKPDDRGTGYTATSLIPVCPRIEFYIQGDREILQNLPSSFPIASKSWCNLGQALLPIPRLFQSSLLFHASGSRILASSQRERRGVG